MIIFHTHSAYAAIPGALTTDAPYTSVPGDPPTYFMTELCDPINNCMRSKKTLAAIYVPSTTPVGTTISITIVDGCDNTANDHNGFVADTWYYMSDSVSGFASADASCPPATSDMNFSFQTVASRDFQNDMQGGYDIYRFVADAIGNGNTDGNYYYNYFRLVADTPGVFTGISANYTLQCLKGTNYIYSCPDTQTVYSSLGQTLTYGTIGGNYSQTLTIPKCDRDMYGSVDIYDFDANYAPFGQTDIRMFLSDTDSVGNTTYPITGPTGAPIIGLPNTGNDQHFWLPPIGSVPASGSQPADTYHFQVNHSYTLTITGLTRINTLQMGFNYMNSKGGQNCNNDPIGAIDSCTVDSAGQTHFLGWAYEPDATTGDDPRVNLSIAGSGSYNSGEMTTNLDYRTPAIESYLDSNFPGTARNRYYGFDWTMSGPIVGGLYAMSGIIRQIGRGVDVSIRFDQANFPNGAIQANCLPPPGCTIGNILDKVTGGTVYPGSHIRFDVNTTNVSPGRQLGVNGPGYALGVPDLNGNYNNYLVNTFPASLLFARGSPVGTGYVTSSPANGLLPTSGNTTIDDMNFGDNPPGGDGNIQDIVAPSTPGSYSFNWGLVEPNVGWTPVTICKGTLVVSPDTVTIQGTLFDADDMSIKYANIEIETCTSLDAPGTYPKTDANGSYSFTLPHGTAFCLRTHAWPAYTSNADIRPWSEGYNGCSGFSNAPRSPNYCPGVSTYECQTAGMHAASGCGIAGLDRISDTGYDITFRTPRVTVQGTIANPYNAQATKYPNLTVYSCVAGVSAITDANGSFSFQVRMGQGYCVGVAGLPAGAGAVYVRPWSEGYTAGCAGFDATVRVPKNYCTYPSAVAGNNPGSGGNLGRYDFQIAGVLSANLYDRTSDSGFDFAVTFPPKLSCSIAGPDGPTYNPLVIVHHAGNSETPPITLGTGNVNVTLSKVAPAALVGISAGTFDDLKPGESTGSLPWPNVALLPATYAGLALTNYKVDVAMSASGDGMPAVVTTCTDTSAPASKPYFKVFGGDIRSGVEFMPFTAGASCSASGGAGEIKAWGKFNNSGSWLGASSQFAAIANGVIDGFASASLRTASPVAPLGLAFANDGTGSTSGVTYSGGFFAGGATCMSNYWNDLQLNPATTPARSHSINFADRLTLNSATVHQYLVNGSSYDASGSNQGCDNAKSGGSDQTSSVHCYGISSMVSETLTPNVSQSPPGTAIKPNSNVTIFVDGDTEILSDIIYAATTWISPTDIPYVTIVVCGNIYIDRFVTEIDGWFIAMPRSYCGGGAAATGGGTIFTCTHNFGLYTSATQVTNCGSGLKIRGAFSAQNIKFQRTNGEVNSAPALEGRTSGNPAEKFIFDPSFWIGRPAQKVLNLTTGTTKLDNVTGLPPVL